MKTAYFVFLLLAAASAFWLPGAAADGNRTPDSFRISYDPPEPDPTNNLCNDFYQNICVPLEDRFGYHDNRFTMLTHGNVKEIGMFLVQVHKNPSTRVPDFLRKTAQYFDSCMNSDNVRVDVYDILEPLIPTKSSRDHYIDLNLNGKVWGSKDMRCMVATKNAFGYSLEYLFYEMSKNIVNLKKSENIAGAVKEALIQEIRYNRRYDSNTLANNAEAIRSIKTMNGYPSYVKDAQILEIFYKALEISEDYQQNNVNAMKFLESNKIDDPWSYIFPSFIPNAAYDPSDNSIYIPAAVQMLANKFPKRDAASNYGTLGVIIGHQMARAIASPVPGMWSQQSQRTYKKEASCLLYQYHMIGSGYRKEALRGNVADNLGLRAAFSAYRTVTGGRTSNSRFYNAHGSMMCTNGARRPNLAQADLRTRVQGALNNLEQFRQDKGCYYKAPCRVW